MTQHNYNYLAQINEAKIYFHTAIKTLQEEINQINKRQFTYEREIQKEQLLQF